MRFVIEAACGCDTGRVRKNNEDNVFFHGKTLEKEHNGLQHPLEMETTIQNGVTVAVFDGMGGERFGEYASFAAARELQRSNQKIADRFLPVRRYWKEVVERLNGAVLEVQREMYSERMGSTMVSLSFFGRSVCSVNVGDSRSFRFRNGILRQLSEDHVEVRPGRDPRKAPLNRYLGIDPGEMQLEPYIVKENLRKGDWYLLCSDGLTDMLTDAEIAAVMHHSDGVAACAESLIRAALERGGRDNVTVIVCMIK